MSTCPGVVPPHFFSTQQPKHPQRYLLPVANLDIVGGDVGFFNPSNLPAAFACPTYLYRNAAIKTKIALLGVLDGVVGQSLTQQETLAEGTFVLWVDTIFQSWLSI